MRHLQAQDPVPSGWGTSAVNCLISGRQTSEMATKREHLQVDVKTSFAERNP